MKKYIKLKIGDIPEMFEIVRNKIYLKDSCARPFKIQLPLKLNEELAKIPAMLLDGSVSKDLYKFMFC